MSQVSKIKKASRNVRSSLNRQMERAEAMNNITEAMALQNHRRETSLGNYRKCARCFSYYTEAGSVIINEEDDEYSHLKEQPNLRRMSKFSLCLNCSRLSNNAMAPVRDFSQLMSLKKEGRGKIYFLKTRQDADREERSDEDSQGEVITPDLDDGPVGAQFIGKAITVMFPTSTGCLIPENDHIKLKDASLVQQTIYKCEEVSLQSVAIIYANQISKYRNVVDYCSRFIADIGDADNRTLSNITNLPDDSQIRGSDKWHEHQNSNNNKRFLQNGQSSFRIEIRVPLDNIETIATNLLIDGFCLTVTYEGSDSNVEETRYLVHTSHSAESMCPDDCEKITLQEYLQTRPTDFDTGRFISSYLTSVGNRMHSLVKNIIKCPSSELYSEEYSFTIKFDTKGVGHIEGFIWPKASLEYNDAQSSFSFFGGSEDSEREDYLHFVDKVVTSTTNEEELRRLGLNKTEASKVISLVMKHQVQRDIQPCLPSLMTMYKHSPGICSIRNIQESKKLKDELKAALDDLSSEELRELSTEEWLQELASWRAEILDDGNNERLQIQFHDRHFSFILDDLLLKMIVKFNDSFIGVYHYSIGCVHDEYDSNNIILRRAHLLDCVTNSYSPFILQAMMSPTAVTPVYGFSSSRSLVKSEELLSEEDINPNVTATHQQISLTEAFSLSETKKFREFSSTPVIYCNTDPDAKTVFIKVNEPSDQSFTAVGKSGHFEIGYNIVTRHKIRLNGNDLLLCETAANYQYVGKEESKQLFSVYNNNLDKIPLSEADNISRSFKLPEMILCSNGQVLRKRKNMGIINYPSFESGSSKLKYSKILLFYPLAAGAEVSENDIDVMYYETNEDQPVDKHNKRLTIIENNERKFYHRLINTN